jgi:alanine dehydrogenase
VVLLLSDRDVMRAIEGPDALRRSIDVTEQSFLDVARGEACMQPRLQLLYPPGARQRHEAEVSLHANLGMLPSLDAISARLLTSGRQTVDHRSAEHHRQWKLLFDFRKLNLVCLMEDVSVHPYLVGAHVGVATRWLAREDARVVGVMGSGQMARGSLRAICAVRPIAEARVYSPNPEHRRTFAEAAAREHGIRATAVDRPEDAVRGVDILTCATNTDQRGGAPVYSADWLGPGTHVNTIASRETDEGTYFKAKVFPASTATAVRVSPPWEPFASLMERGAIPAANLPAELPQVIAGERPGRTAAEDVTLYVGPSLGCQHAAIVAWVYESARARGIGHDWDLDA